MSALDRVIEWADEYEATPEDDGLKMEVAEEARKELIALRLDIGNFKMIKIDLEKRLEKLQSEYMHLSRRHTNLMAELSKYKNPVIHVPVSE